MAPSFLSLQICPLVRLECLCPLLCLIHSVQGQLSPTLHPALLHRTTPEVNGGSLYKYHVF